jgi:hypothetical protein
MENVRAEPVALASWEPRQATLTVTDTAGNAIAIHGFALPHCAVGEVEAPLAAFDGDAPGGVSGAIALYDAPRLRVPHSYYAHVATWHYDPESTFASSTHVLPFSREMMDVMEPAVEAGAVGFLGALRDYPGDSCQYYVPYDGKQRPIPGIWVRGSDGERLRAMLAVGALTARLSVDATREQVTSHNIVGELPGADDETVIVGSHHDGPWASAVEDSSGMALVLAQAAYWSRVPQAERPHRLVFLLNAGHMSGGAGQASFVETHRAELERCVLELHLEHAANEFTDADGELRPTGHPEARWWFTSRINRLEAAVRDAFEAEDLRRSLMLKPDIFGEKPTTDAADFCPAGVPIVNYLTAPFYLFDAMDTLDKIHRPSLVPVTRASIRIIESTAGISAAAMRADRVHTA